MQWAFLGIKLAVSTLLIGENTNDKHPFRKIHWKL